MKYTYSLELDDDGRWVTFSRGLALGEARGYIWCHQSTPGPRLPIRCVRSDGRIVDSSGGLPEVGIGMVAGWPTAEQYVVAAMRALLRAKSARRRDPTPDRLKLALTELKEALAALEAP